MREGQIGRSSRSAWGPLLVVACALIVPALTAGAQEVAVAAPQPGVPDIPVAAAPLAAATDTGDTAWVLVGSALVMLMTPGLAFFYGGLVRRKNMLSILMQCLFILCLVSVQWVLFGYSLAFGKGGGFVGALSYLGLSGVGAEPNGTYAGTIPHTTFMIFQMMFAVITPALIIGAFAERVRFGPFCLFSLLWATVVYDPVAHWVWGDGGFIGLMGGWGALDFAGGTVVHVTAGVSALACALFLGRRKGYPKAISPPHNLPLAVLGAGVLWFGWFGFNAASALGANGLASNAFVVTHVSAATAGLTWALIDWVIVKHPTVLGVITGAVGGLVAITPAAGFVTPVGAMAIGAGVSMICWVFVSVIKPRLGYDDSLDAFGVHGVGGIWGAVATGLFCTTAVPNSLSRNGLFYGDAGQLWVQFKAVGVSGLYAFVVTLILLKAVDVVARLRVSEPEERIGLDVTQHREAAYTIID